LKNLVVNCGWRTNYCNTYQKMHFSKEIWRNWSDFRLKGLDGREVMGLWEMEF